MIVGLFAQSEIEGDTTMAEGQRMTASEHVDVIRESVEAMVCELMEAEIAELAGAEHGERPERRGAQRNGYRPRAWKTRAGEIELAIPNRTDHRPGRRPAEPEDRRDSWRALGPALRH